MRVLLVAGGGGHFSAALSVIERMPKEWEILLIGRKHAFEGDPALSFEYQTAQHLGLPFLTITTGRLQRNFSKHSLISLAKMPVGFVQARKIISDYRPDVVLSFGGYVSVPVVLAAAIQHVPIVLHEQILHAGLANKIAARFAAKICISWSESQQFFPKHKTVLTGNPIRKIFLSSVLASPRSRKAIPDEIDALFSVARNDEKLIYITGGSGGAHGINLLIEGCLEKLLEKYIVVHQTGDARAFNDFDRLKKRRILLPEVLQKRYTLQKFLEPEKVTQILVKADLVISRSGINTVTELLYVGKPCLLIPLPYGQHNEQLTNALFVKKIGLAEIVDQLTVTSDVLLQKIEEMISHREAYLKHTKQAKTLVHPDAADKIVKEVAAFIL